MDRQYVILYTFLTMANRFSFQFIEALALCITGGAGFSSVPSIGLYRSGTEIIRFFKRLGYDVSLATSRVPFTEELLEEINNRDDGFERIITITEKLLDPRDYVGREEKLQAVIEHLNRFLEFDGFEIVKHDSKYTLAKKGTTAPVGELYKEEVDTLSLEHCRNDFQRALDNVEHDPPAAIGSACSTLESTAKAILDKLGKVYPRDQSIQPLIMAVMKELNIAPDQYSEAEIRRILGGLTNTAAGIGVLRTKYSSVHGRGIKHFELLPRHARLAINAASTVGLFLLETYLERQEG